MAGEDGTTPTSAGPGVSSKSKAGLATPDRGHKWEKRRAIKPAQHDKGDTVPMPNFLPSIAASGDATLGPTGGVKARAAMKAKNNPLVPVGILATSGALVLGLRAFIRGEKAVQQRMMRYRVGFQFATVMAIMGGIMWSSYTEDLAKKATATVAPKAVVAK